MRWLMGAVIGMGVLIVAGILLLGVLVAQRTRAPGTAATVILDEAIGTRIAGVAGNGPDHVLVQLQGGGPDRIIVIDLSHSRRKSRISLAH